MARLGTAEGVLPLNEKGGLPTRNWSSGVFERPKRSAGANGRDSTQGQWYLLRLHRRCKRVVEILEGPYRVDPRYGGPEYETLAAMGSYCGVSDLPAVCRANQLCNMYGMDTISCGATIAWAMSCFERGPAHQGGHRGIKSVWNADAMVQMVEAIGAGRALGGCWEKVRQGPPIRLGVGRISLWATKGRSTRHTCHSTSKPRADLLSESLGRIISRTSMILSTPSSTPADGAVGLVARTSPGRAEADKVRYAFRHAALLQRDG